MPHSYLKPLLDNNGSKIILLVLDGLGGIALTQDGKTALEYAKTPHLDRLAEEVGNGTAVVELHAWTECIEDPNDSNIDAVVAVVSHRHGFRKAF